MKSFLVSKFNIEPKQAGAMLQMDGASAARDAHATAQLR